MVSQTRPAWQLRTLRWSAYTITGLLLLALASWLALPHFVKKIAIEQTQEKIGRKIAIGDVNFNPFILALKVSDFVLYEPDQTTPAFSAKSLTVNASSTSLFRLAAVLDEVKLESPNLHVVRLSADGIGRYNFSDIIDRILAMPKTEGSTSFHCPTCSCKTAPSCSMTKSLVNKSISRRSTLAYRWSPIFRAASTPSCNRICLPPSTARHSRSRAAANHLPIRWKPHSASTSTSLIWSATCRSCR